ncbi:HNH endonuclease signature motif containing protein [Pseudomonas sp. MDT1-17]
MRRCTENFTYNDIHHINENREDNRPENLIVLCLVHHRMAHDGKIKAETLRQYKNELKRESFSVAFVRAAESDRAFAFKEIILDILHYHNADDYILILTGAGYDFPIEIFNKIKDFLCNELDYEQRLRSHDPDLRAKQDEVVDLLQQIVEVIEESKYRVLGDDYRFMPCAPLDSNEYWGQVEEQDNFIDSLVLRVVHIMRSISEYASARF